MIISHFMKYFLLVVLLVSYLFISTAFSKAYALVEVKSGESLSVIASRYSIFSEEIMTFNNLEDELVQVGKVLKVPYLASRGGVSELAPKPPPGFRLHTIKLGETLSEVGTRYGISIEAIVGANPQMNSIDSVPKGLELLIPPSAGLVVQVNDFEDVVSVMKDFKVDSITVAKANKITSPADIHEQKLLFLPGVKPIRALARIEFNRIQKALKRAKEKAELERKLAMEQRYTWPLGVKGSITEYYGRRSNYIRGASMQHNGLDIAAPIGTAIVAARAGTVSAAHFDQVYGNIVKIRHYGGDVTWYAHASKLLVEVGDEVERAETIALVGKTGLATGPHVHFEIRSYGGSINPLNYLETNTN